MTVLPSTIFDKTIHLLANFKIVGGANQFLKGKKLRLNGLSMDGALAYVCNATADTNEEGNAALTKCTQYLWAALSMMDELSIVDLAEPKNGRTQLVQRVNDTFYKKPKVILTLLLTAKFLALSDEPYHGPFTLIEPSSYETLVKNDKRRFDKVKVTLNDLRRWHGVLNKFEYSSDGYIKRYAEEPELQTVLDEMNKAILG